MYGGHGPRQVQADVGRFACAERSLGLEGCSSVRPRTNSIQMPSWPSEVVRPVDPDDVRMLHARQALGFFEDGRTQEAWRAVAPRSA